MVCQERLVSKEPVFGGSYDPHVRVVLDKEGVECLPAGSSCMIPCDDEWESE